MNTEELKKYCYENLRGWDYQKFQFYTTGCYNPSIDDAIKKSTQITNNLIQYKEVKSKLGSTVNLSYEDWKFVDSYTDHPEKETMGAGGVINTSPTYYYYGYNCLSDSLSSDAILKTAEVRAAKVREYEEANEQLQRILCRIPDSWKKFSGELREGYKYWNNSNDKFRQIGKVRDGEVSYRIQETFTLFPLKMSESEFRNWAKWESEV